MKKIFVSVPMHGRKLDEINADIRKAVDAFINWNDEHDTYTEDVEFVDTLAQDGPDVEVKNERIWYLGKAIQKLADCDGIIFCEGATYAHGCQVEYEVASLYAMKMFTIHDGNINQHNPLD